MAKFETKKITDKYGYLKGYEYRGVFIKCNRHVPRGYGGKFEFLTNTGSKISEATLSESRDYIDDNFQDFAPVESPAAADVKAESKAKFSKNTVKAYLTEKANALNASFSAAHGQNFDYTRGWDQVKSFDPATIVLYGQWVALIDALVDLEEGL